MVSIKGIGASLLTYVSLAVAQTSSTCTSAGICVAANVPATSGSNDLFLQIKAPSTSGWAGVGIGSRMVGALMFIVYPNRAGTNITVSPRLGKGNVQPLYESSIDFSLLSGSGIIDGEWVANIHCRNCRSWSGGSINVKSTNQAFIWAAGIGQTIASDSSSQNLGQHATRSSFSLNLVTATGGTSGNPFADGTGNIPTTDNGGTGTGTGNGTGNGTTGGTDNGGGSGSLPMTRADKVLIAHGMAFAAASWIVAGYLL